MRLCPKCNNLLVQRVDFANRQSWVCEGNNDGSCEYVDKIK